MIRLSVLFVGVALLVPSAAAADESKTSPVVATPVVRLTTPARDPYARLFAVTAVVPEPAAAPAAQSPAPVAQPIEYSHAYKTRLKIHKVASFAMLPLFGTELVLGQSIYDGDGSGGAKDAHVAVGAGIGVLFGVNTVTGVWNLWESRKDPHGRTRRVVHSLLMLAADAGFTATAALAPDSDRGDFRDDRSAHRTAAITSIGLATAGYLLMLFGN